MSRTAFAFVALLIAAQVAEAVVLCARPKADGTFNTGVRIREACKPTEAPLDPIALGLRGPQGSPGPAGPGPGLTVQDANGAIVGTLIDQGGWYNSEHVIGTNVLSVARTSGALTLAFHVTVDGVGTDNGVFFAGSDCSGPPIFRTDAYVPIAAGPPSQFVLPALAHAGTEALTLYYPTGPSSPTSFGSRLYFLSAASCTTPPGIFTPPDRCCYPEVGTIGAAAAGVLVLPAVVPPFRVVAP